MKQKLLSLILTLALVIGTVSLILASCNDTAGDESSETSAADSSDSLTSSSVSSTETDAESVGDPDPIYTVSGNSGVLDIEWSYGMVCSSYNSLYKNQISDVLQSYSYSNVLTFPKAGTKITFTDEKAPFATKGTYVFSSWTQVKGKWTLDVEGVNYAGSDDKASYVASPDGDSVVYTYVTSYANESIRICYNSGQTKTSTPVFPEITFEVTSGKGTYEQQLEYEASTTLPQEEKDYWFDVFEGVKIGRAHV